MKHLVSMIDVSTAYCNCELKQIDEKIYPAPVDPQSILDICNILDAEKLNNPQVTQVMIGPKPNTYTFTKQLAEHLVLTEGAGLPLAIVRPSIVGAAWREPFPVGDTVTLNCDKISIHQYFSFSCI